MVIAHNPDNRYSHLVDKTLLSHWKATFSAFDRDGGGDVDLKELGVAFRQLGMTPSQDEMERMIFEVDTDQSGLIDFEAISHRVADCPPSHPRREHTSPPYPAPSTLSKTLRARRSFA